MLVYLELYSSNRAYSNERRVFYLALSFFSYFLAVYSREVYVFSAILFFVIIKPRWIRLIAALLFCWFIFISIDQNPNDFLFLEHFIPPSLWDEFIIGDYLTLFSLMQQKWENPIYFQDFIKGLVKVGILPTVLILLIFFVIILFKKIRDFYLLQDKSELKIKLTFPKIDLLLIWFILFFMIYSLFYSNLTTASGLRYWLPISWIPLIYVAKTIFQNLKGKHLRIIIILFLCLYPISWSAVELYVNRNFTQGTGPLHTQNSYFNGMDDLHSILEYNSSYLSISVINGSYFNTTALPEADMGDNLIHRRILFAFPVWINITRNATFEFSLKSPNNAHWGMYLYPITSDYSSGYGSRAFEVEFQMTSTEFQVYRIVVNKTILVRKVVLNIGGETGSLPNIIWDYINITTHEAV
jgi:hypothetical protein